MVKGKCAKKVVMCIIVSKSGIHYTGRNDCDNAQEVCPRTPGEGLEKCVSICKQPGHAEIMALQKAGKYAEGGHAYIIGIGWICRNCQEALFGAGIISIRLGHPDDPSTTTNRD